MCGWENLGNARNESFPFSKLREISLHANCAKRPLINRGKYLAAKLSLFMARPYMGFLLLLWDEADEDGAAPADGGAEKM